MVPQGGVLLPLGRVQRLLLGRRPVLGPPRQHLRGPAGLAHQHPHPRSDPPRHDHRPVRVEDPRLPPPLPLHHGPRLDLRSVHLHPVRRRGDRRRLRVPRLAGKPLGGRRHGDRVRRIGRADRSDTAVVAAPFEKVAAQEVLQNAI